MGLSHPSLLFILDVVLFQELSLQALAAAAAAACLPNHFLSLSRIGLVMHESDWF